MSLFGPSRVPKREVLGAILGEKIGPKRRLHEVERQTSDFCQKCVFRGRQHYFEGPPRMEIEQKRLEAALERQLFRS